MPTCFSIFCPPCRFLHRAQHAKPAHAVAHLARESAVRHGIQSTICLDTSRFRDRLLPLGPTHLLLSSGGSTGPALRLANPRAGGNMKSRTFRRTFATRQRLRVSGEVFGQEFESNEA